MRVFFFGLGYCARRLIAREPWIKASGTARTAERVAALQREGIEAYAFDGASVAAGVEGAIGRSEAIVVSIPPRDGSSRARRAFRGDNRRRAAIAPDRLLFDHWRLWRSRRGLGGRDERDPDADSARARAGRGRSPLDGGGRARGIEADILRLAGIYGPDRNALVNLRRGQPRRIVKPGQVFNRAHVDDIAELTRLVLVRRLEGQIWNVADDEPAPPQDVIAYAAALLGLPPPPEEPFKEVRLSPMTAEFYADNKRVSVAKAKSRLGFAPAYPTYREGLKALAEAGEGRAD